MIHFQHQKSSHARFYTHIRMLISLVSLIAISSLLISCGSATPVQTTEKPVSTLAPISQQPTTVFTSTSKPQVTKFVPPPQTVSAVLDLQPATMSIVGHLDCQRTTVYVCQARVLSKSSNQSALHWTAYTSIPGQIVFSPTTGTLTPGQNMTVTISVPLTACTPGLFFFRGPDNTHTITWAC